MIAKLLLNFLIGVGCAGEKLLAKAVELPEPRYESKMSVEEALKSRRSIRSYKDKPLTLTELSQLLWAAQGITADWGGGLHHRLVPLSLRSLCCSGRC